MAKKIEKDQRPHPHSQKNGFASGPLTGFVDNYHPETLKVLKKWSAMVFIHHIDNASRLETALEYINADGPSHDFDLLDVIGRLT